MTTVEIDTPQGPARAHLHPAEAPAGALMLGHGAGGGVAARDLVAVAGAARAAGLTVALVSSPTAWPDAGLRPGRPASTRPGRRSPATCAASSRAAADRRRPLLRREGRLPHRGAERRDRRAVPRVPAPASGAGAAKQGASRLPELDAVEVPTLVVQGSADPFGMPPGGERRVVAAVPGDHGLKSDLKAVQAAVAEWLAGVVAGTPPAAAARGEEPSHAQL